MANIHEVCEALAGAVGNVPGLRTLSYIDNQANPPQAQVYTRAFDPRMTFGDTKRMYLLGVRVIVRAADARTAQQSLRLFCEPSGSTSVRAAIENETYWPETVDYAEVTEIGQPFELETASEIYWAVDIDVDVTW